MPGFRDTVRCPCRVFAKTGQGIGGVLRTVRIDPQSDRRDALRDALAGPVLERIGTQPLVTRVRCAEFVSMGSASETSDTALRGKDRTATFVVLIEATDVAALQTACGEIFTAPSMHEMGAGPPVHVGDYRLLYGISA